MGCHHLCYERVSRRFPEALRDLARDNGWLLEQIETDFCIDDHQLLIISDHDDGLSVVLAGLEEDCRRQVSELCVRLGGQRWMPRPTSQRT